MLSCFSTRPPLDNRLNRCHGGMACREPCLAIPTPPLSPMVGPTVVRPPLAHATTTCRTSKTSIHHAVHGRLLPPPFTRCTPKREPKPRPWTSPFALWSLCEKLLECVPVATRLARGLKHRPVSFPGRTLNSATAYTCRVCVYGHSRLVGSALRCRVGRVVSGRKTVQLYWIYPTYSSLSLRSILPCRLLPPDGQAPSFFDFISALAIFRRAPKATRSPMAGCQRKAG